MSLYQNHSDQELTSLLRQGDDNAFVELYRRNWRAMYKAAYKRLQLEEVCEDIVQNIFVDLWERRNEIDLDHPTAYLQSAVRFQVIKFSTRQRKNIPLVEHLENTLISSLRSEDPLIEAETEHLIRLWINALPEKRREIFLMYYMENLSSAKIAELLGISQKTVQNQLTSATSSIRSQLSKTLSALVAIQLFWLS